MVEQENIPNIEDEHSDLDLVEEKSEKSILSKSKNNDDEIQNPITLNIEHSIENNENVNDLNSSKGKKRRNVSDSEEESDDDRLTDEDYELLEENLGVKIKRPKFKRIKKNQDEDSDEEMRDETLTRDLLADQLFGGSDNEEEKVHDVKKKNNLKEICDDDDESSEESDFDDFIVDDDDIPIAKKVNQISNPQLLEGKEIFGCDIDLNEFEEKEDDRYESSDSEDEEGSGQRQIKSKRKKLSDYFEPSELKKRYLTDRDQLIRETDIPERMQLQNIQIVPADSTELEDEAIWIYNESIKPTISNVNLDKEKNPTAINEIKDVLDFMKNEYLEVPFIAAYRKEYYSQNLDVDDLWNIYKLDAKWTALRSEKKKLLKKFEQLREFQLEQNAAKTINNFEMNLVTTDDLKKIENVECEVELKDVQSYLFLHHSPDIENLKRSQRTNRLDPSNSSAYSRCRKFGICKFVKNFGLSPEEFGANVNVMSMQHEVQQVSLFPEKLAKKFISKQFPTVNDVLTAAKFVAAKQISHEPLIRKIVRKHIYDNTKIMVRPTAKGFQEIDEANPLYAMKFLKDKPIKELKGDEYFRLKIGEEDKMVKVIMHKCFKSAVFNEIKKLYHYNDSEPYVQSWNELRAECVEYAFTKMIFPELRKSLDAILLAESKQFVIDECRKKIRNWINVAPYKVENDFGEDSGWETSKGIRVMGIAYLPDYKQAAFSVVIDANGNLKEHLRLPHIVKRKTSTFANDKFMKEEDLNRLSKFIIANKPHVIAIGGESREALMIKSDIDELLKEKNLPELKVEIVDNMFAKMYANSKKSDEEFNEYPSILQQAISIARRLLDPLVELSQLCTTDEEILGLYYHPLQHHLDKKHLLDAIYTEFINTTNKVGVDVNLVFKNSFYQNLLQFICGLGPRKGEAIIKALKNSNKLLENRTDLITFCNIGQKVYKNCAGFIKINHKSLHDDYETRHDILDGTRIHPESYEWARKMAAEAVGDEVQLEYAVEMVLDYLDNLDNLDLDSFAGEIEEIGFGKKQITLRDIREELKSCYHETREAYQELSKDKLFYVLSNECRESFHEGMLLPGTVKDIVYEKPSQDELENAEPIRINETYKWKCPFCSLDNFSELEDIFKHFDNDCKGRAIGVKLIFDNGIYGFIHVNNLTENQVRNAKNHIQPGMAINVRIIKIDTEKSRVSCSSMICDLIDDENKYKIKQDIYYDYQEEEFHIQRNILTREINELQQVQKREIMHRNFRNISCVEAIKHLEKKDQGECIVIPSKMRLDHLTLVWKVTSDIYEPINIKEEGKLRPLAIGRILLIRNDIKKEELKDGAELIDLYHQYEDLDELVERYIMPMASYARDLFICDEFHPDYYDEREPIEKILIALKEKYPQKVKYKITASKNSPGSFNLWYYAENTLKIEIIQLTPSGFKFRSKKYANLCLLKESFREVMNNLNRNAVKNGNTSMESFENLKIHAIYND